MLSISKAIKGPGQGEYYLNLASCDDYYLDAQEPPGFWLGEGARAMELNGKVNAEDFRNLFRGLSPDGLRELVRNADSKHRRSGWDLTWSVPKSVSTAWSQAPPRIRSEIEGAVNQAVGEGTRYLESIGVVTRRGEDGVIRERARLLFAAFPHSTSRAQDPQLHVHTLLLNVAVRSDGSTGTIDPKVMFRHQHAADGIFRVELAAQLELRLGLRSIREGRAFELVGVDRELMKTFSTRRLQIESVLKERGLSGAKASEAVAFETRARKVATPREELFARWLQTGRQHGWSTQELSRLVDAPAPPRDLDLERHATRETAMGGLIQHESHFAIRDVTRALAEEAQGRGLFAADVHGLRDRLAESGRLIPIGEYRNEARFTTSEILDAEKKLFAAVDTLRLAELPLHQVGLTVAEAIGRHPSLSEEQRLAIEVVTRSAGGIHLVSGLAGTGKSFAFGVAREIWESQGCSIQGACLSGKAASGLQEGSGIPSRTLHRLLWEIGQGLTFLDTNAVVVIDEAAMVGTRQLRDIAEACAGAHAKLVLIGDARQLQAVEAGGGFAALVRQQGSVALTEIQRQHEPWAREAVKNFAFGRAEQALAAYDARGLLTLRANPEDAEALLLADWNRCAPAEPRGKIMLGGTNAEVSRLNTAAQAARLAAGHIDCEAFNIEEERFHVGDRVLFTRNSLCLGVFNGELGTILERAGTTLTIAMDQGRRIQFDPEAYPHLRLGYALTTHKAQGMTAEESYVLTGSSPCLEGTYVQASRARGTTRLYVATEGIDQTAQQMNHDRPKELASEIARSGGPFQELVLVR